jgi:hypothetical protein
VEPVCVGQLTPQPEGAISIKLAVPVQLFASETVTVYIPAMRPVKSSVIAPFDHKYVYGKTPPVTLKSIAPPLVAAQVGCVSTAVGKIVGFGIAATI